MSSLKPALAGVFAVLLLAGLNGCAGVPAAVLAGLGSAGSVYTAIDKVTEAASPYITTACAEFEKAKAAADATVAAGVVPATVTAKLASVKSYGDAACASPPKGDPLATAIWLGQLAGQLVALTGAKPAG